MIGEMSAKKCYGCSAAEEIWKMGGGLMIVCRITGKQFEAKNCFKEGHEA